VIENTASFGFKRVVLLAGLSIVLQGCSASLLKLYRPIAPKVPSPRVKLLSLEDTVDSRPWHQRMGVPSGFQPVWGVGNWASGSLQEEFHEIFLDELRRSGVAEFVSSPPEDSAYTLNINVLSLSVRDELQWWSDPVPLYIVGGLVGLPMRRVRAEAVIRCRLIKGDEVVMDEECIGERGPRLCSEYLLRRSRTKAACGALAHGTAKMVLRIEKALAAE